MTAFNTKDIEINEEENKYLSAYMKKSKLSDLNVVVFGDSISDVSVNGAWVAPFKQLANCKSFHCYGRGYCRWTFWSNSTYNITDTSDSKDANNVIWNEYNRLVNDVDKGNVETPDLIFILAGTNDVSQLVDLGSPIDTFTKGEQGDITILTNLSDSIRYVCDSIFHKYPNCKIVLGTPLPLGNAIKYANQVKLRNTIIECANHMGLYYIDCTYRSGIAWYREAQNSNYLLQDKIHLSDKGGQLVAQFLYNELSKLFSYMYQER